ncbi:MAG: DNA mismatch repair protein [Cyclobacteriaceae bacterium]
MKLNFDFSSPNDQLSLISKKIIWLSISRLILFVLMIGVLVVGLSGTYWLILLFFPLSFFFIFLILQFNEEKDRERFLKVILEIKQETHKRSQRTLDSFEQGLDFIQKTHPFAVDLDLFGPHSLFQLMNRTVSKAGRNKLAFCMMHLLKPEAAKVKNKALLELSKKAKFLLSFEALGKAFLKEEKPKQKLYDWLKRPNVWKSWYFLPMISGPIVGLLFLVGVTFGFFPSYYISLFIFIGIFLLGMIFKPLMDAVKAMPDDSDLKTFKAWSELLENENFEDTYLLNMKSPIKDEKFLASTALKTLQSQSFVVQNRTNLMYLIFNLLFWTDFLVLYRLERWKGKFGNKIQDWEDAFENWETLVSLASFMKEEKSTISVHWEKTFVLSCKELRHPLIRPDECIANDFEMDIHQKVVLLTGSNMSGKTTFMRTVGINMVLAGMGLSPMATFFCMGDFQLYTSMRNTDSLGESVSSFYAELARIKGLLDLSSQGKPIFFLLDEILKGTNTSDRILGSEALISQLIKSSSKGIISTHDIELSDLENKMGELTNYSFHHDIKDEEIVFDYKIKRGPCPNFNAQKLMKLMGIKI